MGYAVCPRFAPVLWALTWGFFSRHTKARSVKNSAGPGLLGFDYFAAAQAGRANADALGSGPHLGMHRAQVDVPAPFGHIVGVADVVSELRPLAADITDSCHDFEPFYGLMPKL
jgi:hypothetical protein